MIENSPMKELADRIYEVVKDYRNHDNIKITPDTILHWADQFDENGVLVLNELAHIISTVYVSREQAKKYVDTHVKQYIRLFRYSDIIQFLMDTEFLDLQQPYKSQPAILELLDELLNEQFSISYKDYLTFPKRHYVYFDDILASGSTIGKHIVEFLNSTDSFGNKFADKILSNEITLSISVFCLHQWGFSFQDFRIIKTFSEKVSKKINWFSNYYIENHAKFADQKFNIAKPIKANNNKINSYLENLSATKYEDYAYRSKTSPAQETFFTNASNRIKFEEVITEKGIDIINMINGEIKPNLRPLGLINPTYKIFGLGTHFFTWRNIPNNCPLIYWWEVPGHNWTPLFPVINRG